MESVALTIEKNERRYETRYRLSVKQDAGVQHVELRQAEYEYAPRTYGRPREFIVREMVEKLVGDYRMRIMKALEGML